MWFGLIAGWIGITVVFYSLLAFSAREPKKGECMDCRLMDCAECPHEAAAATVLKRAA